MSGQKFYLALRQEYDERLSARHRYFRSKMEPESIEWLKADKYNLFSFSDGSEIYADDSWQPTDENGKRWGQQYAIPPTAPRDVDDFFAFFTKDPYYIPEEIWKDLLLLVVVTLLTP